jgi:hypothetical protein
MTRPVPAAFSVLAITLLLPAVAWAEGAVKIFDCTVARVCDAAGVCEAGSGHVTFRMEPVKLEADGSGRYALSYADKQTDVTAVSALGPFVWTLDEERDTLLISSRTQFLWHRLRLGPASEATVRFLTCSFQQ